MWKFIVKDISDLLKYGPICAGIGFISLVIWLIYCKFREKELRQENLAAIFLMGAYFTLLLEITLIDREPDKIRVICFGLFQSHWDNMRAYVIENLLMLVPMGILLPIIVKKLRKWYLTLITCSICSLLIEVLQYFTGRGYCQLEDLITNTAGAMIGYAIFHGIYTIYKKWNE